MNAIVLLAAGAAQRFSGNKLLHRFGGVPLVVHTARRLLAARDVAEHVAVVRSRNAETALLLERSGIRCVECCDAPAGISASIATGVAALGKDVSRALIALGDQPVPTAAVELLLRAGAPANLAVVPLFRGQRGNPVLFSRAMFPTLTRLEGDVGARNVLAGMTAGVLEVETGLAVPPDLDSDGDVAALEEYLGVSSGA